MSTTHANQPQAQAPQQLPLLAARLNVGAAVCFTEGLFASIIMTAPAGISLHITGTLLALFFWLVFWCYRENKLGADIGDLCFYGFLIEGIALTFYANGADPSALWFPAVAISVLKIIRVYLWANSATQQQAWGKFGPMTWYHSKYHTPAKPLSSNKQLVKELIAALIVAAAVSVAIRFLPNAGRVAITWIVPFTFEFLRGPRQLRLLADFIPQFTAAAAQLREKDAAIANLKQVVGTENVSSGDPLFDQYIAAYSAIAPDMRGVALEYAQAVAVAFPIQPPTQQ